VTDIVIAVIQRDGADLLIDDERPDVESLYEAMERERIKMRELGADFADDRIERSTMLAGTEVCRKKLADLEAMVTDAGRVDILGDAVNAADVRSWWFSDAVSDDRRRKMIDTIVDITILPAVRGRKGFDPTAVRVTEKERRRHVSVVALKP
jgi:hypothetical protein